MSLEWIESETFTDYPDVHVFIDQQCTEGKTCLITNCNDGFIVDIYQEQPTV